MLGVLSEVSDTVDLNWIDKDGLVSKLGYGIGIEGIELVRKRIRLPSVFELMGTKGAEVEVYDLIETVEGIFRDEVSHKIGSLYVETGNNVDDVDYELARLDIGGRGVTNEHSRQVPKHKIEIVVLSPPDSYETGLTIARRDRYANSANIKASWFLTESAIKGTSQEMDKIPTAVGIGYNFRY